ncbi:MAG: YbaB/EbfC family nucleoid-associated protein [Alphaproteobacteria bacterium]
MRDLMGMMKQAKQLQSKMQEMQEQVAALEVTGTSGAGLVEVTLSGKGLMKALKIDPSLIKSDEAEILEDLLLAAHNDARAKLDTRTAELAQDATGGMQLPPGMKLPF